MILQMIHKLQVTGMDARLFNADGEQLLSGTAKTMTRYLLIIQSAGKDV